MGKETRRTVNKSNDASYNSDTHFTSELPSFSGYRLRSTVLWLLEALLQLFLIASWDVGIVNQSLFSKFRSFMRFFMRRKRYNLVRNQKNIAVVGKQCVGTQSITSMKKYCFRCVHMWYSDTFSRTFGTMKDYYYVSPCITIICTFYIPISRAKCFTQNTQSAETHIYQRLARHSWGNNLKRQFLFYLLSSTVSFRKLLK